jgi:predicted ATPase
MLETVREFVAERLAARPDAAEFRRRHADYYRGLAEQADRPLRGAGQNQWLERLQAEAGNLVLAATLSAHGSAAFGAHVLAAFDGDGVGWRQKFRLCGCRGDRC